MSDTAALDMRAAVGKSRTAESEITAWPADVLAATLDRDDAPHKPGDPLPAGWHILYFPEVVKLADTGPDGHARMGDFLPALPGYPRRMWASTKTTFLSPLKVGDKIRRVSTVADVAPKEGKTGRMVFTTLRHEISGPAGLAVVEELSVVYRPPTEATSGAAPAAASPARGGAATPPVPPATPVWQRTIAPTPVLLFRFSALTMNSHRIHYDRPYTMEQEGYPGLLVHGPLTSTLLYDLFRRGLPRARLSEATVRAQAPIYDTAPFALAGAPEPGGSSAVCWATAQGRVAMTLNVKYAG